MRVSEIYLSVQGEGPRAGAPTIFVRFGGCNLRCPGWPCDTQHAIDPAFRKEWQEMAPFQIMSEIETVADGRNVGVCFTGGEPFLQSNTEWITLINLLLYSANFKITALECFSNGTMMYPQDAIEHISFVMDWKLPGSGDHDKGVMQREENFRHLRYKDAVKFTIASREDYDYAKALYEREQPFNKQVTWWYGVVWGKLTDQELIGWVLEDKLPWLHTMQTHNYVWDREKRGI